MAVEGVSSDYGAVVGAQPSATDGLDSTAFMNLLIAQIQHQDPLSPMDNQQFIAQLTQFTTLQELQEIHGSLDDQMLMTQSLNNTMMVDLVGRDVTVEGSNLGLEGGVASRNEIEVDQAGEARIEVRNASGALVDTYTVGLHAGRNDVTWDGIRPDGEAAADGRYSLTIATMDAAGNAVSHLALMTGPVEGLRFQNNLAIVQVAGEEYYVSEIYAVSRRS